MKNLLLSFLSLSFLLCVSVSCEDDDIDPQNSCGDSAEIVDLTTFLPSGTVLRGNPTISDNCLTFDYGASGCDSENWLVKMYVGDEVTYTTPPSRNVIVVLENPEACTAFFVDEKQFDLSELQSQGNVLLVFNDSTQVLYQP